MKTYTHPTIYLPAGTVVVKFFDESKSGTETTPDIIMDIGDVEDGFDVELGELRVPTCLFKFHNKDNYLLGTLLNTLSLSVYVTVNGEFYFYGEMDFSTKSPDVIETATAAIGEVEITALHRFVKLKDYKIEDVETDLAAITDPNSDEVYLRQFFRLICIELGLKFATFADIDFNLARKYKYSTTEYYLDTVMVSRNVYAYDVHDNYYPSKITNMFELLGLLSRDFFFYPSIYFNGTDFILCIQERDYLAPVTLGNVKSTKPADKYLINSLTTQLANMPDEFDVTDLQYIDAQAYASMGEDILNELYHTNTNKNNGYWYTQVLLYVKDPGSTDGVALQTIVNANLNGTFTFTSFIEAMHEAYKWIYFDHVQWRTVTTQGLNASLYGDSKLRYLMPGYYFSQFSVNHYIHSVKKSLKKNESEITALVIS